MGQGNLTSHSITTDMNDITRVVAESRNTQHFSYIINFQFFLWQKWRNNNENENNKKQTIISFLRRILIMYDNHFFRVCSDDKW